MEFPPRTVSTGPGRRVGVVGMGAVGSAFAFALINQGRAREIVLMDKDHGRAEGEAMDLSHCLPYGRPVRIVASDLDGVAECDLIIITAGAAQAPGESRLDLVKRNADIFAGFFPRLSKLNPNAMFMIITNPVDVMTRLALELSGLPPERVFGTGTTLDTARFRLLLSDHLAIDARSIHAYVIGEHGDSEVLVWSRAFIGPYRLEEFAEIRHRPLTPELKATITRKVKSAAYEIIERKGATNFAIGISALRIYEAIRYDQSRLLTVTRRLDGAYGLQDTCLSIPCLLDRHGAGRPMEIDLAEDERAQLMVSAETIDAIYSRLGV